MRIVAGTFRNRRLAVPKDARVRPTADRVREAWMSILGDRLREARVLDLYAGSGALGLEALSRGAATAEFVDVGAASLAALQDNIAALGVEARTRVHRGDALRFVAKLAPRAYDVVLADPPYAFGHATELVRHFRAVPFAATLAVEHPAAEDTGADDVRRYGDTALSFCFAPEADP
jgi:16S rRNA (guanine966-N2)-methyltransferase